MEWQTDAAGNTTCAHGTFGPLETCQQCAPPDDVEAAAPDLEFKVARDDENLCRAVRDEILTIARQMQDQREDREAKDRIGFSTVAKLYDTALKWHNAAVSERKVHDDDVRARHLEAEVARMQGRGNGRGQPH